MKWNILTTREQNSFPRIKGNKRSYIWNWPRINASDFISVQPMKLPEGLIYYLDFKYPEKQ